MPIDRLIVVAGPKAVGKSHFVQRLRERAVPHIAESLQMGDPAIWRYGDGIEFSNTPKLNEVRDSSIPRLVFHYEITGPWNPRYAARSYDEDHPLKIVQFADEIAFVTLWAPTEILLRRFLNRNPRFESISLWLRMLYWHGVNVRKLDADFRPLYRNPSKVRQIYREWLDYCRDQSATQHWLVNSVDERYLCSQLRDLPEDMTACIDNWT